jgi:hypothetical protein
MPYLEISVVLIIVGHETEKVCVAKWFANEAAHMTGRVVITTLYDSVLGFD